MKYVALLRGINVGGKNMIKMETLRAIFASLGFENVKTYVNSGNIVFETVETADGKLSQKICDAIKRDLGLQISVMVRSTNEIEDLAANNPFEGRFENDKDMHVFFLLSRSRKIKPRYFSPTKAKTRCSRCAVARFFTYFASVLSTACSAKVLSTKN